jgi:hypothetical protein
MALIINVNSFVTDDEANSYFADRINSATWFSDDVTEQSAALVSASGILNRLEWAGTANPISAFPMAFPRDVNYYDPIYGQNVQLEDDRTTTSGGTIPQEIKDATCELALYLLNNASGVEAPRSSEYPLSGLTVGSVRLEYNTSQSVKSKSYIDIPEVVHSIIKKYLANSSISRGVRVSGGA